MSTPERMAINAHSSAQKVSVRSIELPAERRASLIVDQSRAAKMLNRAKAEVRAA